MAIDIETAQVPTIIEVQGTRIYMVRYKENDGTPFVNIFTGNSEGVEIPESALLPLLIQLNIPVYAENNNCFTWN